ncbi:DsrE/DsrF/DrsH-like family protein [Fodinisporobacter ferrooxydans]|uniref:DsrE/DsrF/DrsH-like family protein n=1 Tax=Fodinisporobacter ferrooxydans TaxID=2901836 RepID=A0ABY4CGG5_9BACL|nr:DsrE/DsrF/DrsH-like family protein [Alicyclobacillaceae bacterium MYW30-H2]
MSGQKRMSIVVFNGTVDKLYPVSIISSGAVMNDMKVDIFLTFWGLMVFRKGEPYKVQNVSKDYEAMGPAMMRMMQEKNVPSWYDTLLQAKELGDVKVHACAMTADLFDLGIEDFEPIIDDVIGVGEFVEMTGQSDSTLFI